MKIEELIAFLAKIAAEHPGVKVAVQSEPVITSLETASVFYFQGRDGEVAIINLN